MQYLPQRTNEELNAIKELIERDLYIGSFTPETLSYDQIVYLTYWTILHGQEQSYDWGMVVNLHFGDNGPAGGGVYVCPVNEAIKMYKLLFDKDITREEVINKMGSSYHEEIDAGTFQFEGGGNGPSYSISDAYYNNGQYFVSISWYDDSINPATNEPYGYSYTGLLILKKVEDRYCYVSYTDNTGRKLSETEKSEINTYLNKNYEFLSRASYIYFGGLELWNQHAFKEMIFLSPRTNEYSVEDLKNMYIQVSGSDSFFRLLGDMDVTRGLFVVTRPWFGFCKNKVRVTSTASVGEHLPLIQPKMSVTDSVFKY